MAGVLLGLAVSAWSAKRAAHLRKRLPACWPIDARVLANTEERVVWHWLNNVFPDHHVMIKIPVTRFTVPRSKRQRAHWYNLLSSVYCTLTVCAPDGQVVGCIDVPGNSPVSRVNRKLRQTLLAQCGIAYWIVESYDLPTASEIRGDLLGETTTITADLPEEHDHFLACVARDTLRSAIDRKRQNQHTDAAPLSATGALIWRSAEDDSVPTAEVLSQFMGNWQQPNSFSAPLDSRY